MGAVEEDLVLCAGHMRVAYRDELGRLVDARQRPNDSSSSDQPANDGIRRQRGR
jgi:hypothetical protein